VRSVLADSGEPLHLLDRSRKVSAVSIYNGLGGGAKISRARVVAETLPCAEHVIFGSASECGKIGKSAQPLVVIGDHGGHQGLLKHEFGDEDGVGVTRVAPRQIAAVSAIPAKKRTLEGKNFFRCGNGSQQTPNVQRQMSNVQFRVERWALSVERFPQMNSYTHPLTQEQATKLCALLEELGFEFSLKEYTLFFARKNKLSVAVYEKGPKVLVQGKGVEEFVQFELEPKILGEAKLGYEEVHSPEMFEPHFGVDESGKGDFFGPLVISGVYVDRGIARKLLDAGVVDSKRIGSDARIRTLADAIRKSSLGLVETVLIGPAKYNELYEKFGNLNKLLGWGHARVIENLLEKKPDCPRSLSDQFADARVIERSLLRHGRNIGIEQRMRAESDIAVAAASILAREAFISWLERRGKELGLRLERGVSATVKETAKKLVEANGPQALREAAKVHFRTAHEIAPDYYPAPPPRENWAGTRDSSKR
jgi:ribonuclease HIII